jgi:uncharacterized repeat protein (TIGR01451 family)
VIFGYKWHDEDYDGFWDGHETEGLNGWTIELYQDTNGNGILDAGEPLVDWTTTQTNGEREGVFWFADVLPGNYILREVIPERWEQTFPANSNLEHAVTVVAGQQVLGRWQETQSPNFGNARPPRLEIQKFVSDDGESWFDANSPSGPHVYQGLEPQFKFVVTNVGLVDLENIVLSDADVSEFEPLPPGSLRVGESFTTYAAGVWQIGQQENVATVSAARGTRTAQASDKAFYFGANTQVALDKNGQLQDENGDGNADAGETIVYTFTVTNSGNVMLGNVAVTDSLLGEVGSIGALAPGEDWEGTASYTITQADVDQGLVENEAVVTGTAPNGTTVQADAQHTENLPWNLQINVVKTGEFQDEDTDGCTHPDETIRYEFTVTNSANVTLRNVALTDSRLGEIRHIGTLAPNEVWRYTTSYAVTQGDIDQGLIENEATVTAEAPNGDPVAADARHIESLPWCLGIRLDKDGDPGGNNAAVPGKQIAYTFTVENTGNVTLANIVLQDPLLGSVTFVNGDVNANGRLDVGEVWTYTATYAVTQSDIDAGAVENLAIVTAMAPDGQQVRDEDTHRQPLTPPLQQVQVVQFITPISAYRQFEGLFEPQPVAPPSKPQWIDGYLWQDSNQNGIWEQGEDGRKGWFVYLDLNKNGVWDGFPADVPEPFAVTDANGRFVFDVEPGTYHLRVDVGNLDLSDGAFLVLSFPGTDVHVIELKAGQPVIGASGPTIEPTVPNFGFFVYSPFIRPADDHVGRILQSDVASSLRNDLLTALEPWQSFTVVNTTGAEFEITEIQKSVKTSYIPVADQFVTVFRKQSNEELQRIQTGIPLSPAIRVQPNESVQFLAFYDPAIRQGDTVIEQYPDWYGENKQTHPAHTFDRDDHLSVITDTGTTFQIDLVGGSTYDSDILVDGAVDFSDLSGLSDSLLQIREGDSPLFDPLSDMNARCPNGAEGVLATRSWPMIGYPRREIGLGDFGTLNVEWNRSRAPFLDLDPDNSSGARGSAFATVFVGCPITIADTDSRFANNGDRELSSLSVVITNWETGDKLEVNQAELPPGIQIDDDVPARMTFRGRATVEEYAAVLRRITFANDNSSLVDRIVTIEIQATGDSSDESTQSFTQLASDPDDDWELVGNVATATVIIKSEYLTSWQNPINPFDVNGDSAVTLSDVASLVNYLNVHFEEARLPSRPAGCHPFYDVNRDGYCTALDALLVIRELAPQTIAGGEGEAAEGPAQTPRGGSVRQEPNAGAITSGSGQRNAEIRVVPEVPNDSGTASREVRPFSSRHASQDAARAVVPPDSRSCGRVAQDTREKPADPDAEQPEGEVWLADLVADILAVRF